MPLFMKLFLLEISFNFLPSPIKILYILQILTQMLLLLKFSRASLVAQWLRICLPMQGTRVRALVWEDPTCHGAAGPVGHNY